ncbi:MAG: hypothetical protein FWE57_11885 [Chitinispirillia bacterium]|nr:hypothetical protein [Chitinispirillia bacterium]
MSFKSIIKKSFILIGIFAVCAFASGNTATLTPTEPTSYFLTPKAKVNDANHLVIGLHEFSYALPGNLQVQLSLIDNIGKTFFGLKYGLAPNMAIGGGIAGSIIDMGHHGPGSPNRFGFYLTYAFTEEQNRGTAITPHMQIGNRISLGADFAFMTKPVDMWAFIGELGTSIDTYDGHLYLFGAGGLRISPPQAPFLFIDAGAKTNEFAVVSNTSIYPKVFIDVKVCFVP